MPFQKLRLIEPLLRAIQSQGYTLPTAIQTQAIPHVLEGKDLLGCAQTGTGKTAAFALPILQRLMQAPGGAGPHHRVIRVLVLTPTRELAAQIGESFAAYGRHSGLRHTVVFGGVGQGPQVQALRHGVDILVATPGRLLDLLQQRMLTLKDLQIFVLDEADRMLDMGFIHDIRRVIAQLPAKRQTLMFSATMPREIRGLADTLLYKPVEVKIAAESPAADTVNQVLYYADSAVKADLLEHLLSRDGQITRALVFTRTKHGADKVAKRLGRANIASAAIHANKSQNQRIRTLDNFKRGTIRVLVASDIASRGLDVDDISHVINYDLPNEPETYVHRIGRTGRAGAQGQAISFCSPEQRDQLRDIEKLLRKPIPKLTHSIQASAASAAAAVHTHQAHAAHGASTRHRATAHASVHARGAGSHSSQATASPKSGGWRGRSMRRRGR